MKAEQASLAQSVRLDSAAFISVGVIAGLAVVFEQAASAPAWVVFLTWVGYGVLAGSHKAEQNFVVKFLASFCTGIGAGYLAVWVGAVLPLPLAVAVPLGLGFVCGLIAILTRYPPLDLVPAYFLGMISFYGSASSESPSSWFVLITSALAGVVCCWTSSALQTAIAERTGASSALHDQ